MSRMKCYIVTDPNAYEFGVTTVFAETAAKARYAARDHEEMGETDSKDDWLHYSARRFPEGDVFYSEGRTGLDWDNMDERHVLIEHAGWSCDPNRELDDEECGCNACACRGICPRFEGEDHDREQLD